jgi:hypothetical protein
MPSSLTASTLTTDSPMALGLCGDRVDRQPTLAPWHRGGRILAGTEALDAASALVFSWKHQITYTCMYA